MFLSPSTPVKFPGPEWVKSGPLLIFVGRRSADIHAAVRPLSASRDIAAGMGRSSRPAVALAATTKEARVEFCAGQSVTLLESRRGLSARRIAQSHHITPPLAGPGTARRTGLPRAVGRDLVGPIEQLGVDAVALTKKGTELAEKLLEQAMGPPGAYGGND